MIKQTQVLRSKTLHIVILPNGMQYKVASWWMYNNFIMVFRKIGLLIQDTNRPLLVLSLFAPIMCWCPYPVQKMLFVISIKNTSPCQYKWVRDSQLKFCEGVSQKNEKKAFIVTYRNTAQSNSLLYSSPTCQEPRTNAQGLP